MHLNPDKINYIPIADAPPPADNRAASSVDRRIDRIVARDTLEVR